MNPFKYRQMIKYLTRAKKANPELPDVFPASKAPIPPVREDVAQVEAINRFVKANPRQDMAGGGMLVQPGFGGTRQGYAGKDKKVLDKDTIKKIKDKITLKPGQKWNFYDPKKNPKGHTYGVPKGDPKYDIARNLKPGRLETKLKKAKETYQKIKADPELLAQKKAYDRERFLRIRDIKNEQANLKYSTDKDFREKKLEWARQDKIKNPEKYKKKLNDYFAKKGRFPPGNNYKENVWRDMFRSSQKSGQERFLLVDENGSLLTQDKFPKVDGKVRWDVGGAYKKVKFYDTTTKQFVKLDNSIKGKGVTFEKYLDQKSVGGKGTYKNAINGYKNKDDIKNLTFKDSKGKSIRLGTIVQQRLNDGANYINSGVNVQHPDINNAFWKNEVTLASANNQLNYLEQTLERQLKNAGNDINARTKAINNFKSQINKQPGGITKVVEGETLGVKPTAKSVVEGVGKEFKLTRFENFKQLVATLSKDPRCNRGFKSQGGRAGFQDGNPPSLDVCYQGGVRNINSGMKSVTPAQAKNFAAFANRAASLGRGVMKYGIVPEALYVAADSVIRMGMGDNFNESFLRATEYLRPGDQTKQAEMLEADRFFGPEIAGIIGRSIDYKNQLAKVQSLEDQKTNLQNLSDVGEFDYIGNLSQDVKNIDARLQQETDNLNNKFKMTEPELIYAERMKDEVDDARSSGSLFTKLKSKFRDVGQDQSDIETLGMTEQTQEDLNKRMLPQAPTIYKVENGKLIEKNLSEATQTEIMNHVKLLRSIGVKDSTKNLLDQQNMLRGMPISDQILTFGPEATLGFSGTMGEPINKPVFKRPQNVIGDMEKEIVGQTNVANPFDIDISDIGTGLRGFSAAGGGIAKQAGVSSGPPPESGPMSQGLQGLMKRVRNR